MRGIETNILRHEQNKTANEQAGSHEENERKRDLRNYESGAHEMAAAAAGGTTASFFERFGQRGTGYLNRRRKPENNSGEKRHDEREGKSGTVDGDLASTGDFVGAPRRRERGAQEMESAVGDQNSKEAADQRQKNTF